MKVFLSFYHPFLNLARILSQNRHEIYTHPEFLKTLKDVDIPAFNISEVITEVEKVESAVYGVDVLRAYPHLAKHIASYPFLSNSTKRFLDREIDAFLFQRLGNLSMIVAAIHKVMPDVVVLHNDVDPVQRTIALWAKANRVPCIHVPHAIYIDEIDRGPVGSDIHDLITASHLASSGTYQSEWYMRRGMKPEFIRETGIPSLNKKLTRLHRAKASLMLGLNPELPTITYASSWRQDTNILGCHNGVDEWYERILDVIKMFPLGSIQLIVKVHPNSPALQWHIDVAKQKDVRCVVTATHLEPVLGASDLLISYGPSNIVIEASFILGTRLACTHGYNSNPEIFKFGEDATAEEVYSDIKNLLASPLIDYSDFRASHCRHLDEKNNERIARFVEDVVNDKSNDKRR